MFKKITLILSSLAIIALIIGFLAPYFINGEVIKQIIVGQIEENSGYKLTIDGDLDMRVLPFARVTAQNVSVAKKNTPKQPMMKIGTLDIGLRLLPLIGGKIDINRFDLDKPVLTLIQGTQSNNWAAENSQISAKKTNDKKEKTSSQIYSDIEFNRLSIRDGSVVYKDAAEGINIKLDKLNLSASMAAPDQPMTIEATTEWNQKALSLDATIDSLQSILAAQGTKVDVIAQSDLAKVTLKGVTNKLVYEGEVSVDTPSIADVSAWLMGSQKAKDAKKQSLFLVGKANCSISKCGLAEMNLQFNGITLSGSASVETEGARPYVIADLSTDSVDLSPLLAKQQAGLSLIRSAIAQDNLWSTEPYSLSMLNEMDGSFKIKTKDFIANQFKAKNLLILAKIERGFLSAEANNVELYEGKADIIVNLESDGRLDGRASFNNIALDPLLSSLSADNKISGKASGKAAFVADARSEAALINTLGASGNIAIADGSIKGVDIASMIRNVQSAYKDVDTTAQKTDFSEVSASYTITSGVMKNEDLMMKAPLFRVSGKGSVDLPNMTINYRLTPQIVETIQGQGGKEKEGFAVPILITGSLNNPSYAPDLQGLAKDVLKDPKKVKETVKSIKELIKKPKATPAADGTTAPAEKPMNQLKNLLKGIRIYP